MTYSKLYLRPSEGTLTGEGAAGQDRWLVKTGPGATRETVAAWFTSEPGAPVPGASMADFNGKFAICESINISMHPKSRNHWFVVVNYSPFDAGGGGLPGGVSSAGAPVDIAKPSPLGATPTNTIDPINPDTWDPVVMRRASGRTKSIGEAYYEGGYLLDQYADTWCKARTDTTAKKRCPVVNSAIVPLDNLPDVPAGGGVWILRFLRKSATGLNTFLAFENTCPAADITKIHKGLSITFKKHSAICRSVELSETMVNDKHAWAVDIQIEDGSQIVELKDRGFEERALAAAGDRQNVKPFNLIVDEKSRVQSARDLSGQPVTTPILLNGNGKALQDADGDGVFGKWRYPDAVSWSALLAPLNTP